MSYYYYRQYSVLRSSQPVFSPNFDWVLFPEDIREAFSLKGEYPIPKDWHIDGNTPQSTNDNAEDSLSEKDLELDHSRAIYLDTDLKGWLDRRDGKMHSSVHFSPCGRYAIGAIDSSPFAAHGIVVWSTGQMHRETHPVDTAELIAFRDAKISVSFDRIRPICYLTYWTKPATRKAICTVHCFVLDLNSATIIKQLESEVLNTKTDYLIPWEDLVSNFQGSETQAWMSQLEMVERSVILSRCGQYLALSASVGPERFHWTVDLTNPQACDSMENEPASSKSPANPGTIEPRFTYWHQHRYWTSVHHQRVLLHCSARSATNPDHFSSLSCHVQLAVLPAYLSDSNTWLLVPESNHDDMTILITNKENPIELWKPRISWDMAVRKLERVENEHGKDIVALCG